MIVVDSNEFISYQQKLSQHIFNGLLSTSTKRFTMTHMLSIVLYKGAVPKLLTIFFFFFELGWLNDRQKLDCTAKISPASHYNMSYRNINIRCFVHKRREALRGMEGQRFRTNHTKWLTFVWITSDEGQSVVGGQKPGKIADVFYGQSLI